MHDHYKHDLLYLLLLDNVPVAFEQLTRASESAIESKTHIRYSFTGVQWDKVAELEITKDKSI